MSEVIISDRKIALALIVAGIIVLPAMVKLLIFQIEAIITFPILGLGFIGFPIGVWYYFWIYPEDIPKVKKFFRY